MVSLFGKSCGAYVYNHGKPLEQFETSDRLALTFVILLNSYI